MRLYKILFLISFFLGSCETFHGVISKTADFSTPQSWGCIMEAFKEADMVEFKRTSAEQSKDRTWKGGPIKETYRWFFYNIKGLKIDPVLDEERSYIAKGSPSVLIIERENGMSTYSNGLVHMNKKLSNDEMERVQKAVTQLDQAVAKRCPFVELPNVSSN
jgi:hypothetical protein